jgi:hypothetical protein
MASLSDFAENYFSENGEDGIILEMLRRISHSKQNIEDYFVEFGAWDGIKFSNTWNLAVRRMWNGLYIEGDKSKFNELVKNCRSHEGRVTAVNRFVNSGGGGSLENILREHSVPKNFGVLSIDVDGNDFHIWKSLEEFVPTIVLIEFNFTIPESIYYVQPNKGSTNIGNSSLALISLAKTKGYFLAGATRTNLIFILNDFHDMFEDLEPVEIPVLNPVYLWSGYDGSVHLSDTFTLQWHPLYILNGGFQVLPKALRKFSSNYNFLEKMVFKLVKFCWRVANRFVRSAGGGR